MRTSSTAWGGASTGNRNVLDWQHLQLLLFPSGTRARPLSAGAPWPQRQTPAMASGLTDHLWCLHELFRYNVAPPLWVEPKRRGRPRTRPLPDPSLPKRQRGRPRKVPLSTFTVYWGYT